MFTTSATPGKIQHTTNSRDSSTNVITSPPSATMRRDHATVATNAAKLDKAGRTSPLLAETETSEAAAISAHPAKSPPPRASSPDIKKIDAPTITAADAIENCERAWSSGAATM